ncbi:MAG TPA: CAP domain-containing protein [Patescibacteria group bacterium]|nr:CAP domain-containing protein [Patescibacteria group bacterium]
MRKLLVIFLPFAIILTLFFTFSFLSILDRQSAVLGIQDAAAAHLSPLHSSYPPLAGAPLLVQHILTPTPTPTATATPFPSPTATPTPLPPTPTNTIVPTPTVVSQPADSSPSVNSVQSYLLQKINDYRSSLGLSSVSMDSYTCDFAKVRAQEIASSFNHDGFTTRVNNHTLPYPSYHNITENIAETSDYTQVVAMWISSPGHAANMRSDTPHVCVAQNGNYFAYEGWQP